MSRNILLILANAADAHAVGRSLTDVRDGPFQFELVNGCGEAMKRLDDKHEKEIAAVVVDLFLADSQGIDTFDKLARDSLSTVRELTPSISCRAPHRIFQFWS